MAKKSKKPKPSELMAHLATKRDVRDLARKTEAGFDQLVVTLNAVLNLMKRDMRRARRSPKKAGL